MIATLLLALAPTLETTDSLVHVRTHEAAHKPWVRCLAYSSTGCLATGGSDRRLCVWDEDGDLVRRVEIPNGGA
ncbi:MAG: WD40 repeat domain-containing protein [Planctomycetota bacterium]|nr:WD40 repeat domain-containing protein [Planctomycetota bacterium]